MNWTTILTDIVSSARTDEGKAFALGVCLAAGVRIIRTGIRWLKRIDTTD